MLGESERVNEGKRVNERGGKSKVPVKRRAESSLRAMRVIKVVVGRAREGDKGRDKRRRGLV
jgi:hypothetical protein